jgi:hypothetical protein
MGRVNTVTHCGQNMYTSMQETLIVYSTNILPQFLIFPLKELTSGRGRGVEVVFLHFSKKGNAEERGNTKKKE